jgi:hypothetical protein
MKHIIGPRRSSERLSWVTSDEPVVWSVPWRRSPGLRTRAYRDNLAHSREPRRRIGCSTAARHPILLVVQDDTTLDFSTHRRLQGVGRVGDDHGTGFLAHSCLAVLPSGETLGLAHRTIWARPPKGVTRPTRESAVRADTVATIGRRAAASSQSRTGAPTSPSIWRACGIAAGIRSCGRRRTDGWLPAVDR